VICAFVLRMAARMDRTPVRPATAQRCLSVASRALRLGVGAHEEPRSSELAGQERFFRRRVSVASLDCSASRFR
jgi:hypothetical protein